MPLTAVHGIKDMQMTNTAVILRTTKPPEFHIAETTIRPFAVFTAGRTVMTSPVFSLISTQTPTTPIPTILPAPMRRF